MKIKKHPAQGTETLSYQKEVIKSVRKEGVRIWQMENDRVYVTCPQCSKIAEVTDHQISRGGEVSPCVNCNNCSTHYFPRLLDWDGSYTLVCGKCGKAVRSKTGDKKEVGWREVNSNGCSCCSVLCCPECAKKR